MKRAVYLVSLLAVSLPMSQLVYIADADGQRHRERQAARAQPAEPAQADRYPNATRNSPAPQTSDRSYRQIVRAFDAINEEELDDARSTLESLAQNQRLSNYERALVFQGQAQLAYEDGDINEAIRLWNEVIALDSLSNNDHYNLMYQVAQLHIAEEQYDQSLQTLERWFTETGANTSEALALRGNLMYRLERYPEAIAALNQAIAASSEPQPAVYELLMASFYEQDDYAGAARTLEQLIEREPNEVKHRINLAQTYIQMDENPRALEILRAAQAENMLTQTEHWRQLYQLLAYADQPGEAAQVINDGIAAGHLQEDAQTMQALGDNLYLAEKLEPAIEAYGKAAALSNDGNAHQQMGHLLTQVERADEARTALLTAFEKGGLRDPGIAYLLLGESEIELGNQAAARAAFEKALEYDNSRSNAQIWLRNF